MAKEKKIYSSWIKEDIIDIVFEHGGIIKDVAKHLGVSVRYFYEYMDVYPEVKEAQIASLGYLNRHKVETAYECVDKIVENVETDTSNSLKAAIFILSKSKKSIFYDDRKEKEEAQAVGLVDLKEYSQYIADKSEKEKAKL